MPDLDLERSHNLPPELLSVFANCEHLDRWSLAKTVWRTCRAVTVRDCALALGPETPRETREKLRGVID